MRASLYLIGFAAAAIVGAGVAEVGCSSSSTPASGTPEDSGTPAPDTGTTTPPEDSGTGGDAAATCVPVGADNATIDAGSAGDLGPATRLRPSLTGLCSRLPLQQRDHRGAPVLGARRGSRDAVLHDGHQRHHCRRHDERHGGRHVLDGNAQCMTGGIVGDSGGGGHRNDGDRRRHRRWRRRLIERSGAPRYFPGRFREDRRVPVPSFGRPCRGPLLRGRRRRQEVVCGRVGVASSAVPAYCPLSLEKYRTCAYLLG